MKLKREIQQSARIVELKAAASLVQPRPAVKLPRQLIKRNQRLLLLLKAERRRNARLIDQI